MRYFLHPLEKWFTTYFELALSRIMPNSIVSISTCDLLISKFVGKLCMGGLGSCDRAVIVTETGYQFCRFVIFAFSFPSP